PHRRRPTCRTPTARDRSRRGPRSRPRPGRDLKAERDELQAALAASDDAGRTDAAIDLDDACEILELLPNLTEALAAAEPDLRRRVFDAFRLAVAIDRNAGQIHVKALVSSAFTKTRDLQNLVANGALAGARYGPIGDRSVAVESLVEWPPSTPEG